MSKWSEDIADLDSLLESAASGFRSGAPFTILDLYAVCGELREFDGRVIGMRMRRHFVKHPELRRSGKDRMVWTRI